MKVINIASQDKMYQNHGNDDNKLSFSLKLKSFFSHMWIKGWTCEADCNELLQETLQQCLSYFLLLLFFEQ